MEKTKSKSDYESPNMVAIRKYEEEIAALEIKYRQANEAHDWTMRSFYYNLIVAKRTNMEILKAKTRNNGNPIS